MLSVWFFLVILMVLVGETVETGKIYNYSNADFNVAKKGLKMIVPLRMSISNFFNRLNVITDEQSNNSLITSVSITLITID